MTSAFKEEFVGQMWRGVIIMIGLAVNGDPNCECGMRLLYEAWALPMHSIYYCNLKL
jgi:hypothetical protein